MEAARTHLDSLISKLEQKMEDVLSFAPGARTDSMESTFGISLQKMFADIKNELNRVISVIQLAVRSDLI